MILEVERSLLPGRKLADWRFPEQNRIFLRSKMSRTARFEPSGTSRKQPERRGGSLSTRRRDMTRAVHVTRFCICNTASAKMKPVGVIRSEEHTSELQSHSFISYAVFCLKKQKL